MTEILLHFEDKRGPCCCWGHEPLPMQIAVEAVRFKLCWILLSPNPLLLCLFTFIPFFLELGFLQPVAPGWLMDGMLLSVLLPACALQNQSASLCRTGSGVSAQGSTEFSNNTEMRFLRWLWLQGEELGDSLGCRRAH